MSKKVFVTGGTGFIGAYIIRDLVNRGYQVIAFKRDTSRMPAFIDRSVLDKVSWVNGDVLDVVSLGDAMAGADAVVHAAALVSFQKADRAQLYKVNVEGTANVVNLALEHHINRFVHISSVAAIGRKAGGGTVSEENTWEKNKTTTHYAISKYQAELEVWRGMAEGLEAVILNPSTVLGYGDWNQSSCAIFRNIYDAFPWYTNGVNGFVDVEDVAKAAVMLLESDISEERFIVSGANWPFRKLFNMIADGFGKKHPHREATRTLGELAWRIEAFRSLFSGRKPLLTRESARVAQSKTIFDNTKIPGALKGFSFTPLETTIKKACKNYLSAINAR